MLGQAVLSRRASSETAHAPLVAQQLVQRRLAGDREADERRLEREPDERPDRQAERLAAAATVTTATPSGSVR